MQKKLYNWMISIKSDSHTVAIMIPEANDVPIQ